MNKDKRMKGNGLVSEQVKKRRESKQKQTKANKLIKDNNQTRIKYTP